MCRLRHVLRDRTAVLIQSGPPALSTMELFGFHGPLTEIINSFLSKTLQHSTVGCSLTDQPQNSKVFTPEVHQCSSLALTASWCRSKQTSPNCIRSLSCSATYMLEEHCCLSIEHPCALPSKLGQDVLTESAHTMISTFRSGSPSRSAPNVQSNPIHWFSPHRSLTMSVTALHTHTDLAPRSVRAMRQRVILSVSCRVSLVQLRLMLFRLPVPLPIVFLPSS